MIPFFRKIRKQLADDNKPMKYMRYAIGEIILVVIGILVALWINNMNQGRIKQKKIDSILVKIQNDLLQDIENADYLIESYIRKDSITDRFIGGDLTPKDIKNILLQDKYSLESVTKWSYAYKLQSKGYSQLMNMLDDLPGKYNKLLNYLSDNFSIHQIVIDKHSNNTADIVRQYNYYLANNHSWMANDQVNDELSDAQIDYMLNNPRFKNQMVLLVNSTKSMVIKYTVYRETLMTTYFLINELLGDNANIPKEIRKTSVANEIDAERLVGVYQLKSGPVNTAMGEQFEIYREDKNLFFITPNKSKIGPLLFLDAEKPWFVNNNEGNQIMTFQILQFEYKGKNTLKIVNINQDQTHWLKVVNE